MHFEQEHADEEVQVTMKAKAAKTAGGKHKYPEYRREMRPSGA